jgi:hypothetical protein
LGNFYKLVRSRETGEVQYFKLKDTGPEISPAEKIDAEPTKKGQVRYRVGSHCWFVLDGRWFCCEVVSRPPNRIVLRPVTGWDADRQAPWPHDGALEISDKPSNSLFQLLRPLKARVR